MAENMVRLNENSGDTDNLLPGSPHHLLSLWFNAV